MPLNRRNRAKMARILSEGFLLALPMSRRQFAEMMMGLYKSLIVLHHFNPISKSCGNNRKMKGISTYPETSNIVTHMRFIGKLLLLKRYSCMVRGHVEVLSIKFLIFLPLTFTHFFTERKFTTHRHHAAAFFPSSFHETGIRCNLSLHLYFFSLRVSFFIFTLDFSHFSFYCSNLSFIPFMR